MIVTSSSDRWLGAFRPRISDSAMPHTDPFLYPAAYAFPDSWSKRVGALLSNAEATEAEIEALLATQATVPSFLRMPRDAFTLYDHAGPEPRLKLMNVLRVTGAPSIDARSLKKALTDVHAGHLEGFDLSEKGSAAVLAAGLADSPITRVRFLDAYDSGLPSTDDLATLLKDPRLAQLERLHLGGAALKDRFGLVTRMPAASSVRALFLGGCEKLTKRDFEGFAAAPWARLESLSIGSSRWEPKAGSRDAMWKAPWLRGVRRLAVLGMTEGEVPRLLESGVLPGLETLVLSTTKLAEADVLPLLPHLRACTAINLSVSLGIESARALIASGCVPNLEVCELAFSPEAHAALGEAGLAHAAVKNRRSTERGYSFRI